MQEMGCAAEFLTAAHPAVSLAPVLTFPPCSCHTGSSALTPSPTLKGPGKGKRPGLWQAPDTGNANLVMSPVDCNFCTARRSGVFLGLLCVWRCASGPVLLPLAAAATPTVASGLHQAAVECCLPAATAALLCRLCQRVTAFAESFVSREVVGDAVLSGMPPQLVLVRTARGLSQSWLQPCTFSVYPVTQRRLTTCVDMICWQ